MFLTLLQMLLLLLLGKQVVPHKFSGRAEIVPLEVRQVVSSNSDWYTVVLHSVPRDRPAAV